MTCMCGDTYCQSCGPAQGADLKGEQIVDAVCNLVGDAVPVEHVCAVVDALRKFGRIDDLLHCLLGLPVEIPAGKEDIAKMDACMDAIRPCSIHGCWPDPEYGCVACFDADNKDVHVEFEASKQDLDGTRRVCTGCEESIHFDEIVFVWNDEALCEKCNESRIARELREGERC